MARMFIIVKHGGKQYWAQAGEKLSLEKIEGAVGDTIELDVILSSKDGKVSAENKTVKAQIVKHYRDDKVIIFKKKRRHRYELKKGHRQHVTRVLIPAL